ncbi:MAG: glutamine--fructose-6-phosphate transaminase (isomerizing) [Promethearchaeati archaeon SRVP18_Atabeyarchaeia-1]
MCGIIGVASKTNEVAGTIISSLKRLEYRGYDSSGIAIEGTHGLAIVKDKGSVDRIAKEIDPAKTSGHVGIGHTRWATHGPPSRLNAHPHTDCSGRIAVAHNGIIENFMELRKYLEERGHEFVSETDTEIIPHLIEEFSKKGIPLRDAFREALMMLKGSYGLVMISADDRGKIFCARKESPILIGIGKHEVYCASDITAFLPFTNRVILLRDGEMATLEPDSILIEKIDDATVVPPRITTVDWSPQMAQKSGYRHFMLKEIHEQPYALRNTLRIDDHLIEPFAKIVNDSGRVILTAAGTSNHACIIGKYMFTHLAQLYCQSVISSEFSEVALNTIGKGDTVIALSQSGETMDTLDAAKKAKEKGASILSITNVVGSSITHISDQTIYTQAGPEIGVAATKTFIVEVASLALLSLELSRLRGTLDYTEAQSRKRGLLDSPRLIEDIIKNMDGLTTRVADKYYKAPSFLFLGRGISTATAMEGALKLKEISYTHAEGYPAGESKHGPISLVEPGFPVVFIAPPDQTYDRLIGNIMEMKAREARILTVAAQGDDKVGRLSDAIFGIPGNTPAEFSPIPYIVPLQLLAYHIAVKRGLNPDKPRNLAKSVTVR